MYSTTLLYVLLFLSSALYSLQAPPKLPIRRPNRRLLESPQTQLDIASTRSYIKTPGPPASNTKTLSELVNKRPAPRQTEELKEYAQIFAAHPKVKELDRHTNPINLEALQEGWATLRKDELGYYTPRKMENSIDTHLRSKVPEPVVAAVRRHWRKNQNTTKGLRYRSHLPKDGDQYKNRLKKNKGVRARVRLQQRKGQTAFPFEDYMTIYKIPKTGLTARELEVRAREFRNEYSDFTGDSSAASKALKDYLERNYTEKSDIEAALGARSTELRRLQKLRYSERKAGGVVGSKRKQQRRQSTHQVSAAVEPIDIPDKLGEKRPRPFSNGDGSSARDKKIQAFLERNKTWHRTSNL